MISTEDNINVFAPTGNPPRHSKDLPVSHREAAK